MAMFGVAGRERTDALYGVLNQPADTTALEREQAPGAFEGDLGSALGTGIVRGWSRGAVLAADAFTPALSPIAKSIDDMFGTSADEWLLGEQEKARRLLLDSKVDPKTNGAAAQLVHGLGDVLTTVATTLGVPPATGAVYGYGQYRIGLAEGLDPTTALAKATIEGVTMGASVALPAAVSGGLAFRMASGAALNVGIGIPERLAVSTLLNARGFPDMARQYAPLDATAITTELVLGAAFGGLLGPLAKAKMPPREAIPPSTVDAALVAHQTKHAEIDVAPGVPADTRSRQAHAAALDQAVESLVMGRDVNVEALLRDAGFVGQRPDFDALRVLADELDRAGVPDLVAQVRAIEAEARGRGLMVDDDSLGSVVLSDRPVESRVAGAAVRESEVRIGEDYVPTRLMLVEAGDVQATMLKADNQFRDRTRVASEQQIADIASRLDARLLMDAPVMDYGAPVLGADGTVIGGNGRAAAVARAYEQGTAAAYRDALRAEYGEQVDTMRKPMLVRILQREVDVKRAAVLSNEGGALRMSALEQAKVDAERMGDFRAFEFGEDGALGLASNMGFIREWVGQMPQNQRAAIMDADGRLSAEGAGRLRNAILYRAYGDSPTLARLVEATDPGSRNIAAALTRVAPIVADAREAIARGDLYPMGLHGDLVAAVEKLDALRRDGLSVDDWLRQIDAFGDGMTGEARLLVTFMDRNIRSVRAIADGVAGYYGRLAEAGDPKQGSMFEAAQPVKSRMLELALGEGAPMYTRRTGSVDELTGLPLNADGTVTVYHHTSAASAEQIRKTGRLQSAGEPDVYVTTRAETDTGYGDTSVAIRVKPDRLEIDDEFPDGRRDFRLSVGRPGGAIQVKVDTPSFSRGTGQRAAAADLTTAFRAMFGRDADRLLGAGRVHIVQSVADLPGSGHPADVGGMFWRGESWIVADNTGLAQIRGRVLHEVGEHAGMQAMLGDALYADTLARIEAKVGTDPVFKQARELAEARANRPEHVPAETLAYLVENAPELPLVRRVLAAARQWLYRTTGGRFVDLTQADLQMMAVASLRRAARVESPAVDDAPRYSGPDAMGARDAVESFHARARSDTIRQDPIDDTTMPDARLLTERADAENAQAKELSQGFLPAVECFLRVGE